MHLQFFLEWYLCDQEWSTSQLPCVTRMGRVTADVTSGSNPVGLCTLLFSTPTSGSIWIALAIYITFETAEQNFHYLILVGWWLYSGDPVPSWPGLVYNTSWDSQVTSCPKLDKERTWARVEKLLQEKIFLLHVAANTYSHRSTGVRDLKKQLQEKTSILQLE